jgi:hypothetical protein
MKRNDLLRHLRIFGCYLKREGGAHSIWFNPETGEAIPRHQEISNLLARSICRGLSIPEIGKTGR